jgi:methyltransferase (TIGR00027 family)
MSNEPDAPVSTTAQTSSTGVIQGDHAAGVVWTELISTVADSVVADIAVSSQLAQDLAWRWVRLLAATQDSAVGRDVQSLMLQEIDSDKSQVTGITRAMLDWLSQAFTFARLSLLAKYVPASEVHPLGDRLLAHAAAWPRLVARLRQKMAAGLAPADPSVQLLAREWQKLLRDSYFGDDPVLERQIRTAFEQEPDLLLGVGFSSELIVYVQRAIFQSHLPAAGLAGQDKAAPKPSAYMVALQRAAHQLLETPLILEDPVALKILGAAGEAAIRQNLQHYSDVMAKGMRTSVVVRSRLAEDQWRAAWQKGARQYVILGAGLDTYAYRPGDRSDMRIFEVDLPSTQKWKRDLLLQAGISAPPFLTYAPVDFQHGTLAEGLSQAGFRQDRPAFFAWLGVTLYLDVQDVIETLRYIASCPAGSSVVFDYSVSPALLSPLDRIGLEIISKQTAERGEPWKSHFDPDALADILRRLGFGQVEHFDAGRLTDLYLRDRTDGLRMGSITRLIQATV